MNKQYMDFVPNRKIQAKLPQPSNMAKPSNPNSTEKPRRALMEAQLRISKATKITKRLIPQPQKNVTQQKPAKPSTFQPPKFINTNNIEKRPLSKTVYERRKSLTEVKEVPAGPIAIIDKPEDKNNIGLIITIILTVILGAAVGTIAFLLIPR